MNPMLATDGALEQTGTLILSRQCVGAAAAGAGASNNGKGMIAGGVGQASHDSLAGQQLASFLVPEDV